MSYIYSIQSFNDGLGPFLFLSSSYVCAIQSAALFELAFQLSHCLIFGLTVWDVNTICSAVEAVFACACGCG